MLDNDLILCGVLLNSCCLYTRSFLYSFRCFTPLSLQTFYLYHPRKDGISGTQAIAAKSDEPRRSKRTAKPKLEPQYLYDLQLPLHASNSPPASRDKASPVLAHSGPFAVTSSSRNRLSNRDWGGPKKQRKTNFSLSYGVLQVLQLRNQTAPRSSQDRSPDPRSTKPSLLRRSLFLLWGEKESAQGTMYFRLLLVL